MLQPFRPGGMTFNSRLPRRQRARTRSGRPSLMSRGLTLTARRPSGMLGRRRLTPPSSRASKSACVLRHTPLEDQRYLGTVLHDGADGSPQRLLNAGVIALDDLVGGQGSIRRRMRVAEVLDL